MESKHKNALIGALLAVVFVMAVGYAAFAQTLNINGTATITDASENWNVHFDTKQTTQNAVATSTGAGGTNAPSGTIGYSDSDHTATVNATLIQPGDSVEFTLKVLNEGSITANINDFAVKADTASQGKGSCTGNTCTFGNIVYTVTPAAPTTIATDASSTVKVKAEFKSDATEVGTVTSAGITITMNAEQAGA